MKITLKLWGAIPNKDRHNQVGIVSLNKISKGIQEDDNHDSD